MNCSKPARHRHRRPLLRRRPPSLQRPRAAAGSSRTNELKHQDHQVFSNLADSHFIRHFIFSFLLEIGIALMKLDCLGHDDNLIIMLLDRHLNALFTHLTCFILDQIQNHRLLLGSLAKF